MTNFGINVEVTNDVPRQMGLRVIRMERAVKTAVTGATEQVKTAWRADVAVKLGRRLSGAVRSQVYPKGGSSLNAAGLVFTKAPKIIGAHERGAVIQATSGFWLAIPLPAAGKGLKGRISPGEWERRTGRRLRFVYRKNRSALLVDDGTTTGATVMGRDGFNKRARGFRNRTVPMFALVPQVKLPKRLNLKAEALKAGQGLPGRVRTQLGAAI